MSSRCLCRARAVAGGWHNRLYIKWRRFYAAMLELTGRRTIGHRGSARVMVAKPPIPADGPQTDRSFRLALVCRRFLADTQPGSLKLERDLFPFLLRALSPALNQARFEFGHWKPVGFHPCQPTIE